MSGAHLPISRGRIDAGDIPESGSPAPSSPTTSPIPCSQVDDERVRADQMRELAYFVPMLMAANTLSSSAVVWVAWDEFDRGMLLAWIAVIWALVARALNKWIQNAGSTKKRVVSVISHKAIFWASIQGLAWAMLPAAFFVGASSGTQTVIVAVMMFMTCAGAMGLIRIPMAAFAFAGITLGSLIFGLLAAGGSSHQFLAALCCGYAIVGYLGITFHSRAANEHSVAQQKLEHQQELINLLLKDFETGSGDWLWETDAAGYLTHVSQSFTRVANVEAHHMIGRKLTDLNFGTDSREWQDLKMQADNRQPIDKAVVPIVLKGQERWWTLTAQPRFDEAKAFIGYRGVGGDITAQRHSEIALEEAKNAAESANAAKSKFLAVLSHELRSPLNAVIGFSEIIADPETSNIPVTKYSEYACEIRDSSRHLLSIIDDLLDIARIESGAIEIAQENICAEAMFDAVCRSMTPLAKKRNVDLVCQESNVETNLLADPRLVRQVLINLVANAIKFTPSGGKVTIGAELGHDGSITLWVRDTGIGIAEENIQKIFEPFTQIEGELNRSFDGVGLGLSIALHLARAHGGELTLDSKLGEGTTVRFTLPSWRMSSVRRLVA
ncbi:MAG: hypothetical protein KDJ46_11770 [Rhodobiaceae bacterium]|nr:hypothetical protein [Rhodobiaceae bacterium]